MIERVFRPFTRSLKFDSGSNPGFDNIMMMIAVTIKNDMSISYNGALFCKADGKGRLGFDLGLRTSRKTIEGKLMTKTLKELSARTREAED